MVTLRRTVACALGIGVLGAAFPLSGHHGFESQYDINKKVTITGSITKVEWENPHVHCYLDVKDANGAVAHYVVEGGAPRNLNRHGWTVDTLKIQDTVTILGYMSRDGTNNVSALRVTLPNGQKLDMQF
jgi:uncharacterized protein DUF6152